MWTRPFPRVRLGMRSIWSCAIARLPRGARTVFVLHDVEGYRHLGDCGDDGTRRRHLARAALSRAPTLMEMLDR